MMQTGKTPFVSFDYKEAAVERERLSQALDGYACLGWELDRQEGAGGQIRLFLRRDRHILTKAELTRLERQFEACLDAIRALEASVPQRAAMAAGFLDCSAMSPNSSTATPRRRAWLDRKEPVPAAHSVFMA